MGLGLNASSALIVVMNCSSLKQPEDKHLASQRKSQERPTDGSMNGELPLGKSLGRIRNRHTTMRALRVGLRDPHGIRLRKVT